MSGLEITCRKSSSASDVQAKLSYRILYSHRLCWTWLFNSIFVVGLESSWKYPLSWRTRTISHVSCIFSYDLWLWWQITLLAFCNRGCERIYILMRFNLAPKDYCMYVNYYENFQDLKLCESVCICSLTKITSWCRYLIGKMYTFQTLHVMLQYVL